MEFIQLRNQLDIFLEFKNGKFNQEKFTILFDRYAEDLVNFNESYNESILDEEDMECFYSSTTKHQIFDYFPYSDFPERNTEENDLPTVLAGFLLSTEKQVLAELNEFLKEHS